MHESVGDNPYLGERQLSANSRRSRFQRTVITLLGVHNQKPRQSGVPFLPQKRFNLLTRSFKAN